MSETRLCTVCSVTTFYRYRAIDGFRSPQDGQPDASAALDIIASTNEPVRMGDWLEVLDHTNGAVDASSAN